MPAISPFEKDHGQGPAGTLQAPKPGDRDTPGRRGKIRQLQNAHPCGGLKAWDCYCQTDSITARDVTLDQASRIDLDAAKPFHSKAFKTALKGSVNGIRSRETDQRFFDLVALPQLPSASQPGFSVNKQNQR
jgi:hypothetical protein